MNGSDGVALQGLLQILQFVRIAHPPVHQHNEVDHPLGRWQGPTPIREGSVFVERGTCHSPTELKENKNELSTKIDKLETEFKNETKEIKTDVKELSKTADRNTFVLGCGIVLVMIGKENLSDFIKFLFQGLIK